MAGARIALKIRHVRIFEFRKLCEYFDIPFVTFDFSNQMDGTASNFITRRIKSNGGRSNEFEHFENSESLNSFFFLFCSTTNY